MHWQHHEISPVRLFTESIKIVLIRSIMKFQKFRLPISGFTTLSITVVIVAIVAFIKCDDEDASPTSATTGMGSRDVGVGHNSAVSISKGRSSKVLPFPFPFLAVVSFPNELCHSAYGAGACYSAKQCSRNGGFDTGETCAYGYGVCCYFSQTCTSPSNTAVTVTQNLTHLVTPPVLPQQCRYTIPRQKGVCQIRVDFLNFGLTDANDEGDCVRDTLILSGQDNFPHLTLCGCASPPDHLYLDYGQSDIVTLNMDLLNVTSMHDLLITMIKCDSPERAPDGCAQYYTDQRSDVKSFNFPQQQLNSEYYMVCVKTFPGSDGIRWMQCTDTGMMDFSNFFITGIEGLNTTGLSGSSCVTDYVQIHGSTGGKYCGADFGMVDSIAKPYMMWVNFDEAEFPKPTGPLNMTSGCAIGWTCAEPVEPCKDGGTCRAPPELFQITDVGNTGFCLRYVVE